MPANASSAFRPSLAVREDTFKMVARLSNLMTAGPSLCELAFYEASCAAKLETSRCASACRPRHTIACCNMACACLGGVVGKGQWVLCHEWGPVGYATGTAVHA